MDHEDGAWAAEGVEADSAAAHRPEAMTDAVEACHKAGDVQDVVAESC